MVCRTVHHGRRVGDVSVSDLFTALKCNVHVSTAQGPVALPAGRNVIHGRGHFRGLLSFM